MAKIKLVKGTTSLTKRNFKSELPKYLTYVNTAAIIGLLLHMFLD